MAKRQIHYQSAEYYRIKFLRSIIIALIVILLSLFPLMMMTQRGGSIWITVVVGAILALYFSFNIRANYRIWKDVQKEESRSRKKVHRRAPVRKGLEAVYSEKDSEE